MIDLSCVPNNIVVCDGSCLKNPGPGGWALVHVWYGEMSIQSGSSSQTTNNIMELQAMIEAMKLGPSTIYTDSMYVVNGANYWIHTWQRNGWRNAQKDPVKNLELWKQIASMLGKGIIIRWVKGHASDDVENAMDRTIIKLQHVVDMAARAAANSNRSI